jgi:exopolyphosphatase
MAAIRPGNFHYCTILFITITSLCSAFLPVNKVMPRRMASFCSFADFLAQTPRFEHLVIGNPAGDADSIVSSLSLSYVDHLIGRKPDKLPIVSVPRADLALRRETVLLLEMVKVHSQSLTCLDDIPSEAMESTITLVDHNKLLYPQFQGCKVVEILDHHIDEQQHVNVVGELRKIEFEGSTALVASTCTLIAERYLQSSPMEIPADLSFSLLGVILLDTANMSHSAAKGTVRDQAAIDFLVERTDWSTFSQQSSVNKFFTDRKPNTRALYDFLAQSKFDIDFWMSLSVIDALRLDYKQFTASSGDVFGAASVLLPLSDFLAKRNVEKDLLDYMTSYDIAILVILSMVIDDENKPKRGILICGSTENRMVDSIATYLQNSESLRLTEIDGRSTPLIKIRQFAQGNPKASRKQIVPILMTFYDSETGKSGSS